VQTLARPLGDGEQQSLAAAVNGGGGNSWWKNAVAVEVARTVAAVEASE